MSGAQTATQAAGDRNHRRRILPRSGRRRDQADRTRSGAGPGEEPGRAGAGRHGHVRQEPDAHLRPRDRRDRPQAVRAAQRDHASTRSSSRWKARWRGLHYLVMNSETGTSLKLRVLNLPKRDLSRDLQRAVEFDQSQLFKKIYENEFGTPGGEPYGALIGDYEWTQHPDDVETLRLVSNVAAGGVRAVHLGRRRRHVRLRQLARTRPSRAISRRSSRRRNTPSGAASATARTRASSTW